MENRILSILTLLIVAIAVGTAPAIAYAAPSPVTLTIISPHPDTIKTEYGGAFSTYYQNLTGQPVNIKWIDVGGTTNDVNYIQSNFAATPNGIGIDLFFGGGVDPFVALADQGLLVPYQIEKPANLTQIPATLGGIPCTIPSTAGMAYFFPDLELSTTSSYSNRWEYQSQRHGKT